MSERDLVKELKAQIADLTADRDDALAKVKSKESRMKQVLIKFVVQQSACLLYID